MAQTIISGFQTALEIMSGIFILYSVYSIRKYIRKGLKPQQINQTNLALHSGAFLLYILSLPVDDTFEFIWMHRLDQNSY